MELFPRMTTLVPPPTPEVDLETTTPATLPASELATLDSFTKDTLSPSTSVTEYPSDFRFLVRPKEVTTTSSSCWVSALREIVKEFLQIGRASCRERV